MAKKKLSTMDMMVIAVLLLTASQFAAIPVLGAYLGGIAGMLGGFIWVAGALAIVAFAKQFGLIK